MTLDINILKRYFSGKYSRRDFLAIRDLLGKEGKEQEIRKLMEEHWREFSQEELPSTHIDHILDRMQHQIRLEENRERKEFSLFKVLQRIAAVLFIPLALTFAGYLAFHKQKPVEVSFAEIQCPYGVRTKFRLPDGTTGFLNSGSKLKYPVVFGDTREVYLSGEGFFEVVKNHHSLFRVKTKNLDVNVWGTVFDVIAWEEESSAEVVLQSGKVDVVNPADQNQVTLHPNQKMVLDMTNGQMSVHNVVASQYTGWTEGKLVFRNEPMEEVARRLSRWYNADILVGDPRLNDYTFHATFADEQLDQVLKLLSFTTPITYQEEKRTTTTDNEFSKRKIVLKINSKKINNF